MGQEPEPGPAPEGGQEPPAIEPKPEPQSEGFDSLPPATQEEIKKLRTESAKWRVEAQQRQEKLDEIAERDKSEVEKAQGKIAKAEERATAAEAALLRFEVANDKEVPAKLVPLLTATTKEALEAQAALILENAKPVGDEPKPDFDGGVREPASEPKSAEQQINDLALGLLVGPNSP